MKLRTITSRAAAAGATTALAAGALVGVTTTSAVAAEVTNTYTCVNSLFEISFDQTMTVSGELPVPQYWAGAAVPAGLLNLTVSAPVDPTVAGMLGGYGVTSARSDDYTIALGTGTVPVPISGDFVTEEGATTWEAAGSNEEFTTPNPGQTDGNLPQTFTLTAESGAVGDVPFVCTLKEGETAQTLASLMLLRQQSETVAKNVTAKKGKKVTVNATVSSTSLSQPVMSGKVTAVKGKKVLGSGQVKNGKAKLNLGKLPVGKHKVTVTYAGIPSVAGSSDKITVTVKKK